MREKNYCSNYLDWVKERGLEDDNWVSDRWD